MPQGFSNLNPDDCPFDGNNENLFSFSGDFCEQLGLNYQDDGYPLGGVFYTSADLNAGLAILEVLKNSETPLTKLQLATLRYPKIFNTNSVKFWRDENGECFNITKQNRNRYIDRIGKQLRAVTHRINSALDEIPSQSDQFEYLKTVSLAIPICTDSRGRAKYVYHGPDAPQPPEILEMSRNCAETHKAKNSRLLRLVNHLCEASNNLTVSMLDPTDIPGHEPSQQLDLGLDFL